MERKLILERFTVGEKEESLKIRGEVSGVTRGILKEGERKGVEGRFKRL